MEKFSETLNNYLNEQASFLDLLFEKREKLCDKLGEQLKALSEENTRLLDEKIKLMDEKVLDGDYISKKFEELTKEYCSILEQIENGKSFEHHEKSRSENEIKNIIKLRDEVLNESIKNSDLILDTMMSSLSDVLEERNRLLSENIKIKEELIIKYNQFIKDLINKRKKLEDFIF